MTKVVIHNENILASVIGPTGVEHRRLANRVMEEALDQANLSEVSSFFPSARTVINIGRQGGPEGIPSPCHQGSKRAWLINGNQSGPSRDMH